MQSPREKSKGKTLSDEVKPPKINHSSSPPSRKSPGTTIETTFSNRTPSPRSSASPMNSNGTHSPKEANNNNSNNNHLVLNNNSLRTTRTATEQPNKSTSPRGRSGRPEVTTNTNSKNNPTNSLNNLHSKTSATTGMMSSIIEESKENKSNKKQTITKNIKQKRTSSPIGSNKNREENIANIKKTSKVISNTPKILRSRKQSRSENNTPTNVRDKSPHSQSTKNVTLTSDVIKPATWLTTNLNQTDMIVSSPMEEDQKQEKLVDQKQKQKNKEQAVINNREDKEKIEEEEEEKEKENTAFADDTSNSTENHDIVEQSLANKTSKPGKKLDLEYVGDRLKSETRERIVGMNIGMGMEIETEIGNKENENKNDRENDNDNENENENGNETEKENQNQNQNHTQIPKKKISPEITSMAPHETPYPELYYNYGLFCAEFLKDLKKAKLYVSKYLEYRPHDKNAVLLLRDIEQYLAK